MNRNLILWIIALLVTLSTVFYQRKTGPTYPVKNTIEIGNENIMYLLDRSHGGEQDYQLSILASKSISGEVFWKRYKTNDNYIKILMKRNGKYLTAYLPHQPPAGKLQYKVVLTTLNKQYILNDGKPVIIRFKGDVPVWILILHIITIFAAMFLSNRTGLEYFSTGENILKYALWTLTLLITGGLILGPIMQYYAFGAFWTGFPFGHDLTDNKTLITFIVWVIAFFMMRRNKEQAKKWALGAAIVLLIVYLIPHSLLGSELDYSKLDKEKVQIENKK